MATDHALIQEIRGCLSSAETNAANAEVWQARAGQRLMKLKEQAGHGKWLKYLKTIGISQQRASELMANGEDIESIKKDRERKKQAMRKLRAKRKRAKLPPRGGDLDTNNLGCNYNAENPKHVAEGPDDTDEVIRRRIFLHRAAEALRHAKENGFTEKVNALDKADDSEIDNEIISAAQTAAEAWSDLYEQLVARHTARKGGYSDGKEKSIGKALH